MGGQVLEYKMSTAYPLKSRRVVEKDVLTEWLPDLVALLQYNVLSVSNGCLSKKLISKSLHGKILDGRDSPEEKATRLLMAIINSTTARKDCFQKFMIVLEDYEETVKSMTLALDEALERVYKEQEQCEDRTSVESVETSVLTECTVQLSGACEGLLVRLASECYTEQIITKEVYQVAKGRSHNSKVIQTKLFLRGVSSAVEKDRSKFSSFVKVLSKHPPCHDIARKLQQSAANLKHKLQQSAINLKTKSFRGSHKDHQPDSPNIPVTKRVPKPFIQDGPRLSSGSTGSLQDDPTTSSLNKCIGSRNKSQNSLNGNGNEKSQRIQELEIQSEQKQKEKEQQEHMKRLQEKILTRDREKDRLQEDVQTLKYAAYQAKHASPETIQRLLQAKEKEIDAKDKQIRELIKERDELRGKLNVSPNVLNTKEIIKKT